MSLLRLALVSLLTAVAGTTVCQASTPPAPPQPFTATYQVLRDDSPMGTSSMSLKRNADGNWAYVSHVTADSGLAALLGAKVDETSHFRVQAGQFEALAYDYRMHVAFKTRTRHVDVDWKSNTVQVKSSKDGAYHYKTQPGLVERHLLILQLGRLIAAGKRHITLPVAVLDRVKTQTFVARTKASVTVPAGTFEAWRVDRTHDDKGWSAWYAPDVCGTAPIKLTQESGGNFTLLLKSCTPATPTANP